MNALTNGGEVVQALGSARDAIKFYRCFYMSAASVASWLVDAVVITGFEGGHVFWTYVRLSSAMTALYIVMLG